ncbi:MAG: calcium/sodium antiporter [Clostridia bacterium]|nr:calcium/sodium antiporter [Clostridia bacterium]
MATILDILLLLVGFVLLIKGADFLVDGAVGFARRFHIPTLVIGMTIVAFGTSAPEAAVSITAAMNGNNAISISNILGSNLFNLLAVGGLCALIRPLPIKPIAVNRDYPFHLVITMALLLMIADPIVGEGNAPFLSRAEGLLLLLLMGIYMYMNIKDGMNGEDMEEETEMPSPWKSLLFFLGGLAGVIFGGDLVVDASTAIAKVLGVSDTLIGLTVVALGTSLPELITSLVACRKGEVDLAWGNIVGSNVFNILFVLGISATLHPVCVEMLAVYDTAILFVIGLMVYLLTAAGKKISRPVGGAMVITYIAYVIYIILR